MDLLFKLNSGQTIVGQSNFVDHYANINNNMTFAKLNPSIRQATALYIVPWLGQAFYDDIAAKYQGSTLNGFESALCVILRDAVAYYTVYHHASSASANLSELGFQNRTSTDGTTQYIAQWQYRNIMQNLIKNGDAFLDDALKYIEDNASQFGLYSQVTDTLLINTANDLTKYINTNNSIRAYTTLIPFIKKATTQYIKTIITDTVHDALITAIDADTLTAAQTSLLEKIQPCLAEYALHIAIPHLTIDLTEGKLTMLSSSDGMSQKNTAQTESINALLAQTLKDAKTAEAALIDFVVENKADYGITYAMKKDKKVISSDYNVMI